MNTSFLPEGTKEPSKSNYYKFVDGSNIFRVLAPAVVGWEYWTETYVDGVKKSQPHRVTKEESIPMAEVTTNKFGNLNINYFWAFPVWNFTDERVQILEITQASIRKGIKVYLDNPKWGNPMAYNIEVTKSKNGDKTEYQVIAEPKEELDIDITDKFNNMKIDMKVWMDGGDPFTSKDTEKDAEAVLSVSEKSKNIKKDETDDQIPF